MTTDDVLGSLMDTLGGSGATLVVRTSYHHNIAILNIILVIVIIILLTLITFIIVMILIIMITTQVGAGLPFLFSWLSS